MDSELKIMIKRVVSADILIAFLVGIIASVFFKGYTLILVLGLIIALINFMLNTVISNYVLMQGGVKSLNIIGAAFRVIITIVLAVIMCGSDRYKYIAIILGYTFHYFAIIFYGLTAKDNIEGK